MEIGRYSSSASNSYIKLGSNSNALRITNNNDTADIVYIENDGDITIGGATAANRTLGLKGASNNDGFFSTFGTGFSMQVARNPLTGTFSNTSTAAAAINLNTASADSSITFWTTATNNVTPTQRMVIDKNGNIGIGTGLPGARLQINTTAGIGQYIYNTTSAQAYLALGNATTGIYSQDFSSTIAGVLVGVDSDESAVFWNASGTRMRFGTSGTGRMHITAGGNVLIGPETITPAVEFEVHGSNHLASFVNSSTTANDYSQIQIKAGSALNWIWSANQNSTSWGGANSLNIQSTSGSIQFFTAGSTARMRIHESSGNVDIQNGNLVFANGHGIDFSATTEATGTSLNTGAEVLDDYEEGFWQPRPIGSTSGTADYYYASQQLGSYIKIGNLVHLTWYVSVNDSSPTGSIHIANLPFAAKSGDTTNSKIVTGSCMWDGLPLATGQNVIIPYMSHGAANLQFYQSGNNTGWVQTPVDTQWSMIGGITYRTT